MIYCFIFCILLNGLLQLNCSSCFYYSLLVLKNTFCTKKLFYFIKSRLNLHHYVCIKLIEVRSLTEN